MKVLVTGATGYLGSHVSRALVELGWDVVVLKRRASDMQRLTDIAGRVNFEDIDDGVEAVFDRHAGLEAIVHIAGLYARGNVGPGDVVDANLQFPLRLLNAAVKRGVRRFLSTGTTLPPTLDSYALAKSQFVEWGKVFAEQCGIQFINIRLEHFFGPDDDESKFTAFVINACCRNEPRLKITLGEQARDFLYIDDTVAAYMAIATNLRALPDKFSEISVGSGEAVRIRAFVETVHRLCGSTTYLDFGAVPYRRHELMYSCADTTTLQGLGWRRHVSLEDGIARIIRRVKAKGVSYSPR